MSAHDKDISEVLALAIAQVRLNDQERERKKRLGLDRLPSGAYEMLMDLGKIEACRKALEGLWHKDNDDYRKGMLHLSKLEWDLREGLKKLL